MEEETKKHPTVPIELSGKWIAWNKKGTEIVASGKTPQEVIEAANDAGEMHPILGKSPPAHVRLIGGACIR